MNVFSWISLIWRPPQRDNCLPWLGRIGAANADLHERRQADSALPSRQPCVRVRIEIGNFEAGHISNQSHPRFVSFHSVGVVLRLSHKTNVELTVLFVACL